MTRRAVFIVPIAVLGGVLAIKGFGYLSPTPYAQKLKLSQYYSHYLPSPLLKEPATWDRNHSMRNCYVAVERAKNSAEIATAWTKVATVRLQIEQAKESFVKSYRGYAPSLATYEEVLDPRTAQPAESVAEEIYGETLAAVYPLEDAFRIKSAQIKDGDLRDATGEVKTYIEYSRQASIRAHLRFLRFKKSLVPLAPDLTTTRL